MAIKPVKVKLLKRLLQGGSDHQIANALEKIHPSDISFLFSELAEVELRRLVDSLLQVKKAGQTLKEIPEFLLPDVLEQLDLQKLADIISKMDSDDAIYLLNKMPQERWHLVLERLEPEKRAIIEKLLLYPKGTAGSVMSAGYIAVSIEDTVEQAIQKLREHPDKESLFYIYVVQDKRLVGVLPLRKLVLSEYQKKVSELMATVVVTVHAHDDQEKAAQMVGQYNLLAIPVVNDNRELLGVITVDDVIDIFQEEATEDMYHMAGLSEEDRAFTPLFTKVKKRLPWMFINLATAFLASAVVSLFEGTISKLAVLAAYMPIVAGMGGNTGTQSLVVITRSIALGEIRFDKAYRAVLKEMGNGLILGVLAGLVTGLVMYVFNQNIYLGLIIFLAMMTNLAVAGFGGAMVPLILKALKLDPAVGSGVIVTAMTDVTGFFVFLQLAQFFLQRLVG